MFTFMKDYWVAPDASINHFGWAGLAVPKTGTTIRVASVSNNGNSMQVKGNP